ncbi:MAG: hypothetical protein LBV03_03310 [Fusobacteriales bacterium]|nr:hypothetical protein [Fusobacteriales bacterium]
MITIIKGLDENSGITYNNTEKITYEKGSTFWFKNNKLEKYRIRVDDNQIISIVDYIFDKKGNLKEIIVSNPLLIKSNIYGEEVKEYKSSIGSENYYFNPDGDFIKKEIYFKYK